MRTVLVAALLVMLAGCGDDHRVEPGNYTTNVIDVQPCSDVTPHDATCP